jgi:hypothetical protein
MTFTVAEESLCVKKYFEKKSYKYAITKFRETFDHNNYFPLILTFIGGRGNLRQWEQYIT